MPYARLENNTVAQVLRVNPEAIFDISFAGLFQSCGSEVEAGWLWDGGAFTAPPAPPVIVPQVVTRKQARKALAMAGLFASVQPAITAIADPLQRQLAQIDWEDAQEYERSNPFLRSMATALSLSDEALDALFTTAAAL